MTPEKNPETLLAAVGTGCRESFSLLYDDFSAALFGIVLGIVKNRAEAEEVLQEVFLSIWRKAGKYDKGMGKATTWLITIARNKAIDHLRSRQRREQLHENAGKENFIENAEPRPDSPLIASEQAEEVREALKALPDDMRRVLELAYFHSLTQTEISEFLHQPLGTIKSRIRRGMERVRLLLKDNAGG
ncbi:MAG: sigma-70 family RNA polymerase sigma factor [Verrucomicrobiota bacterium JB023]|nr:sigma-70 family RNA polymerase sigma factor [Verrucomicrobiota bacterium JB023]